MTYFILDVDKNPVPVADVLVWANWFETADRLIKRTLFPERKAFISTVFLGIDHSFGAGPPHFI